MIRRRINLIILLALAAILATACAPAAAPTASPTTPALPAATSTSAAVTLTDGLGRQVTLQAAPQKIISLAPSNTEILFAIGAGSQVVGRDEFSDYPAEAKSLPSIGGSMGQYDMESIASLQPDLVLAAELNTPEQVRALEDLHLSVYYLSNPKDLDGLYANLETVGNLTGHTVEAGRLVGQLQERVTGIKSKLEGAASRPLVYYELDATDPAKPYTMGPGTFIDQLIQLAGGENIGGRLTSAYGQLSLEEILVANPDVILLGDAAYGVTPEIVAARPGWSAIQAVKDNRVFAFDDNLVSRPTPRLVDGLDSLARLIHPEAFQ
jgi:iron complex transport system substrate-binding protein